MIRFCWSMFLIIAFIITQKVAFNLEIAEAHDVHVNFNIMICFEVLNEIARNLAGYLHVPGPSLKDVGFMLIPEFKSVLLNRVGDVLTFIPFILMIILALGMDYKHLSKFISDQLRVFALYYLVRACCEWVTLLPGPATHCRPGSTFNPPKDWVDIISHMPSDGVSFTSCGDLIPSGHIGFTVLGIIAILRALPRKYISYRKGIFAICVGYVLITCFFIIAYRKHYTVDLVVGVFFAIFIDGWKPSLDPLEPSYEALSMELPV